MIQQLKENVAFIMPENGLELKLQQAKQENRPLIIKLGFDPTAPDLHLGHAVVLKKLKQFQDLGHQVVILVGSFTARIGDPTGKNKARKPLSIEEVQHNAETYISQLSKVIDVQKAKIVFNSDWLDMLNFIDVIQLMSKVTVAQLMHRNDFKKRFEDNTPIAMHELIYPVLQGFDSVQIKADIEMGGTDQMFNCTMGRQLQEAFQMPPQIVMCMPLLRGLDGNEKMSKSLNNIIGLTDSPDDMFGKTMSIPDQLINEFLDLATHFTIEEKQDITQRLINGENPMKIKKEIAVNIISGYHCKEDAANAALFFENQFQNKNADQKVFKQIPVTDILKQVQVQSSIIDLCHSLKPELSKSAIKRLVESGAVQINNQKIPDSSASIMIEPCLKIKIGKRDFFELV
ncbi:tyrosine--tRNA ligase [Polluticaenibacter yanchengensis]|uniref:Tyrosine--tRNA ligase n=1 Tax=Polluticaenibacter yanchengensis TaxID=3014562 RepID=A0ABT4UM66_9BACT|nr:tyrosine--tRNA ligase [Chitinophagaceae bacterium LY-5]